MKKWLRIVKIVLLAVFLVGLAVIIHKQLDYRKGASDYAEAETLAKIPAISAAPAAPKAPTETAAAEETPEETPKETPAPTWEEVLAGVDLAALQAVNPDVVGWIIIPNTEISYPLLQGPDNDYYLDHTWKGSSSSVGAIFLDHRCGMDDLHFIIYGHRMRNGSMFHSLRSYKGIDYWREHPSVYLVNENGVKRYDVYAAYEAGVDSIVYQPDLEGREEGLIQSSLSSSVIETGIVPEVGDQIVTLSTCTGNGYSTRWVVQAVCRAS